MNDELEFTNEQLTRLDYIQDAAGKFFNTLSESTDIVYDLDDIWNLIYLGCDLLHQKGRNVRLPTHVTKKDGTEYITDWYEVDNVADMEH